MLGKSQYFLLFSSDVQRRRHGGGEAAQGIPPQGRHERSQVSRTLLGELGRKGSSSWQYATRDAIKAQLSVAEYNVRLQTEPHVKEEWTRKKLKTNSGDSLKVEPGRALGKRPSIKKER